MSEEELTISELRHEVATLEAELLAERARFDWWFTGRTTAARMREIIDSADPRGLIDMALKEAGR